MSSQESGDTAHQCSLSSVSTQRPSPLPDRCQHGDARVLRERPQLPLLSVLRCYAVQGQSLRHSVRELGRRLHLADQRMSMEAVAFPIFGHTDLDAPFGCLPWTFVQPQPRLVALLVVGDIVRPDAALHRPSGTLWMTCKYCNAYKAPLEPGAAMGGSPLRNPSTRTSAPTRDAALFMALSGASDQEARNGVTGKKGRVLSSRAMGRSVTLESRSIASKPVQPPPVSGINRKPTIRSSSAPT